jgi:hypothetical protein
VEFTSKVRNTKAHRSQQDDRVPCLDDAYLYMTKINEFFTKEIELVQNSMKFVLDQVKVSEDIYIQASIAFGSDQDSLRDTMSISMLSPFKPTSAISFDEASKIFTSSIQKAISKVCSEDILKFLEEEDEVAIVFDTMVSDIAKRDHQVDIVEFKALANHHELVTAEATQSVVKETLEKLWKANQEIVAKK